MTGVCAYEKWDESTSHDHETKTKRVVQMDRMGGKKDEGRLHKNIMIYAKSYRAIDDILHIAP